MASFESNLVDNEVKDDRHCGTWCFRIAGIDVQEIMVEQIGEILEDSDDIAEKKNINKFMFVSVNIILKLQNTICKKYTVIQYSSKQPLFISFHIS